MSPSGASNLTKLLVVMYLEYSSPREYLFVLFVTHVVQICVLGADSFGDSC